MTDSLRNEGVYQSGGSQITNSQIVAGRNAHGTFGDLTVPERSPQLDEALALVADLAQRAAAQSDDGDLPERTRELAEAVHAETEALRAELESGQPDPARVRQRVTIIAQCAQGLGGLAATADVLYKTLHGLGLF